MKVLVPELNCKALFNKKIKKKKQPELMHTYNLSPQDLKPGGSGVQSQIELQENLPQNSNSIKQI